VWGITSEVGGGVPFYEMSPEMLAEKTRVRPLPPMCTNKIPAPSRTYSHKHSTRSGWQDASVS